jgi:hypothetical protein
LEIFFFARLIGNLLGIASARESAIGMMLFDVVEMLLVDQFFAGIVASADLA